MSMSSNLHQELAEMTSAEDFLNYFAIPFDTHIVEVNRLHILQRFRDYLKKTQAEEWGDYAHCLAQAYQDFVHSNALTEKVFKVFHRHSGETRIAVADIGRRT